MVVTGSAIEKSSKLGANNWFSVFMVYLEPDPGARQRDREVVLPSSLLLAPPEGGLSEEWSDFVAHWLVENVPLLEARALADCLGRGLTLREAGDLHGAEFRRLCDYRRGLAAAVKEEIQS